MARRKTDHTKAGPVRHVDPATVDLSEYLAPREPRLDKGKYIVDAFGDRWFVVKSRATDHGFEIYEGRPVGYTGPMKPSVIISQQLLDYLIANRHQIAAAIDLPLSLTTIRKIRRIIGHGGDDQRQERDNWWRARLADLESLTVSDFCVRHRVSTRQVDHARERFLQISKSRRRPEYWWQRGAERELILSNNPRAWIADKLGVSTDAVNRYRWLLRGGKREDAPK